MSNSNTPRLLFEIAHPKHFFQFQSLIDHYEKNGEVLIIAKEKDIVTDLLDELGYKYIKYGASKTGILNKIFNAPRLILELNKIVRKFDPDYIISKSSPYANLLRLVRRFKTITMPDSEGVWINEKLVIPLTDYLVTPSNYTVDYGTKHLRINGFFESAYLHPSTNNFSSECLSLLHGRKRDRYCIIRFISWNANHDISHSGFSDEQKIDLVKSLEKEMDVYISSEGGLPGSLQKNELRIPVSKMHCLLNFADLYIGDSQTMAAEAAILGTPAVRVNSWVGVNDMSNFVILEHTHNLLHNYPNIETAVNKAIELAQDHESKAKWIQRRDEYFSKIGNPDQELKKIMDDIINCQLS